MKIFTLKLIAPLLLLVAICSFVQQKQREPISLIFYEYDSYRLESREDFKAFHTYIIYPGGRLDYMDENGKSFTVQINQKHYEELVFISKNNFSSLFPENIVKEGVFFAGKYAYLDIYDKEACFKPTVCNERLKMVLVQILDETEHAKEKKDIASLDINDKLIYKIKTIHKRSNLNPIKSAPPGM